jgi:hypothetical protein
MRIMKQDYDHMIAWGAARRSRRKTGTRGHNALSPVASAALRLLAHRTAGIVTRTRKPDMADEPQAQRPNGKVDDGAMRG